MMEEGENENARALISDYQMDKEQTGRFASIG